MNIEIAPKETEMQANWTDAMMYCLFLNVDNKIGWRLPTKEELNEIYHSSNDFEKRWYWTSTEINGNFACVQSLSIGTQHPSSKNGSYHVRAVRAIK